MNFDFEDPLGSDDSFFEEPKALNRRTSITKKSDKKSIESLFNIGDTKTSTESVKNIPENVSEKSKNTVTFEEPLIQEDGKIADTLRKPQKKNEDWLSGSGPTSVLDKDNKKIDFLDDILSIRPTASKNKKVTSFDDILKESKLNTTFPTTTGKLPDQVKDVSGPTEATSNFNLLSNISKEKRRSRRGSSTVIEDTLGLFDDAYQSGDYYTKDRKETPSTAIQSKTTDIIEKGVPDWLGVSLTTTGKTNTEFASKTRKEDKDDTREIKYTGTKEQEEKINSKTDIVEKPVNTDVSMATKQHQIATELQNAYSSLQQQETFLLISLQLKKYEENLEEVKRQQQEIMGKQEKHYNDLLDKYIVKQQTMDNNIRLQQERINNHIQMILSNPSTNANKVDHSEIAEKTSHLINENVKDFENIINILKQRHQEEIFIMEESYKKQISLLEKSAETIEEKLSNDIINISKSLEEKIDNIHANHNEEILYYKQKIHAIEEQHSNEIKLIKENHSQTLEEMKRDCAAQIDYLKDFRQQENILLKDGPAYSQKLDTSIEILNSNTKALEVVQEKLINNYDKISAARDSSIESREKEIILMRNALDKCREAAENERSQLLALIRSLETKIAEQNNNAREERWALQQASATFVARSAALDRESEYNRTVNERDREQLKTLKESMLAEQEKIILQLTEEKLQLSAERVKTETLSRLTNNYESEKIKAEAETAIQVAKELTMKINQERDHLHRQKNDIEILRRSLADREREIDNKEMELDYLIQNSQKKINEDKKIINEARKLEIQYKERLQDLQTQWISLSNREKKLAEEKVILSKERLALYTTMKQARGCVLCKSNDNDTYQAQEEILHNRISDAESIRFRLDILEDEKNSEVSKEENNLIIHEVFS